MEPPQSLRLENLKSVAMATVVTRYPPPPNRISTRSSWGKHPLKIWWKSVQGFRLWNTHKLHARGRRLGRCRRQLYNRKKLSTLWASNTILSLI